MELLKPEKNSSGCRFNDDAGYTFSGTPSLTVTLLISASKHMKDAIELTKWHLPAIGTKRFWSPHQASSSVILGHIADITSELEVAGVARSTNHFMNYSLCCLGAGGKVTADALANRVPPIFFSYQV